jgi:hypothetical protein
VRHLIVQLEKSLLWKESVDHVMTMRDNKVVANSVALILVTKTSVEDFRRML